MEAIVNLTDVPLVERQHARAGLFRSQSIMNGVEGTPENFYLQLSHLGPDFQSPRHRHNFDQVRVQLAGDAGFTRDGVMKPGMLAYFPEGVFYGPQSNESSSSTLVLQFGGASGSGYISEERFQQGVAELKQVGTFGGGVFRREKEDGGRKNQDAYEAVWEHVNGRRMEYPKSDFEQPVFLDPSQFEWGDEPDVSGVRRKELGRFSSRGLRISLIGIDAGAMAQAAPHSLLFVMSGEGRSPEGPWTQHATMRTGAQAGALTAATAAEVLELQIPPLR